MIKITLKKRKKDIKMKKGAAVAETVLLTAISLVLVVVLFYPSIRDLLILIMARLNDWFVNSMNMLGIY